MMKIRYFRRISDFFQIFTRQSARAGIKSLEMETSIDLDHIYILNHSDWSKIEKTRETSQKISRLFFLGVSLVFLNFTRITMIQNVNLL